MLALARHCGIFCADSRMTTIGNKDVLLVKRFDRHRTKTGYFRSRMASALTLLGADDGPDTRQKWSYLLLAEELRRITSGKQIEEHLVFRSMNTAGTNGSVAVRIVGKRKAVDPARPQ